jgi:peptidoglycan hydrolase-like protein with peptidoglycan-binding domain
VTQLSSPAQEGGTAEPPPGGPVPDGRRSRLRRRRNALIGVGAGAGLLAVGGLIGASFVKSPAQLAADTAPPAPTVTTATVVSQILTSSLQMRGVVYPSTEYDVYANAPQTSSSSSGADSAGAADTGSGSAPAYITKLDVAAGDTIKNGELLAEIDGAPLFALTGPVPAWRDLLPGDSGPDVLELQKALASLGYYDGGDTPGYYGTATQDAVYDYFWNLGYQPPSDGGVPEADVVFLPSLPASVLAVNGAVGQQAGQPFLEVSARDALALTGELPPGYAGQVKDGLKVRIYDEVTGIHAVGTVAGLGTATTIVPSGTIVPVGESGSANSAASASSSGSSSSGSADSASSGDGTPFMPLTVDPSKPLPAALNGENVLVTVETGQTEGPVLTVPVAAIVTNASGASYVTVVGAHGRQTRVAVTPGLSENGYVQVTPVTPGTLAAGDNVVVSG